MFLDAIADSNHPERQDMLDWHGESFDLKYFDSTEVNDLLQS